MHTVEEILTSTISSPERRVEGIRAMETTRESELQRWRTSTPHRLFSSS